MMNKKVLITGLIAIGIIGLTIVGYNYYHSKMVEKMVDHFRTEIKNTQFVNKVIGKLKTQDINPEGLGIGISAKGEKSLIIYFKDSQPDDIQFKAQKIAKEVIQENKLGDFKVEFKKVTPSQVKDPDL